MSKAEKPDWIKTKPEDLENTIKEISKTEKNPSKIGVILRDKHGIPKSKLLGVRVKKVMKKNESEIELEDKIVKKKIETLKKHIESNKHDYSAQRSLTKKLWAVQRLEKIA